MEPVLLIDLWALGGIGLEIFGFLWLLKYSQNPTLKDWKNWLTRNGYEENWKAKKGDNYLEMTVNHVEGHRTFGLPTLVKPEFVNMWLTRKNQAIIFVMIGLSGQFIQVLIPHITNAVN